MNKWLIIILVISSFISCTEEVFPPLIITGDVTEIDSTGAVFHAKITELGNDDNLEYGFVWDTISKPTIDNAEKIVGSKIAHKGNIEIKAITYLLKSKTYHLRAYIKNSKICSYGNEVQFVSQGGELPKISSISPLIGNLNDTLIIIGNSFSTRNSSVKINNIEAKIVKLNQDSIFAIIPNTLNRKRSEITLKTHNQTIAAKDSFSLFSPIISSINNNIGTWGDQFTIKGRNFLKSPSTLKVHLGKEVSSSQIIDDETIKVTVPDQLVNLNSVISISMNNIKTESDDKYNLLPPEITDFYPQKAITGSKITINGKYFSPIAENNNIYIGGVKAKTISATQNSLEVILAKQDTAIFENRNADMVFKLGDSYTYTTDDKLIINDKWFRLKDAPISLGKTNNSYLSFLDYKNINSYTVKDIAYIGLNKSNEFWKFNSTSNSWTKLANFPGTPRIYGTGFVYENKIYFGRGREYYSPTSTLYNDWWEYNISTNSWSQKKDCPIVTSNSIGYSCNSDLYLSNGCSRYNDHNNNYTYNLLALKYDPINDSWKSVIMGLNTNLANYWIPCKTVGDSMYLISSYISSTAQFNKTYILDTKTKQMQPIANFIGNLTYRVNTLYINEQLYLRMNDSKNNDPQLYYFDATNNEWVYTQTDVYNSLRYGISFEVGDLGYVGLGESNQLYEFDPNR